MIMTFREKSASQLAELLRFLESEDNKMFYSDIPKEYRDVICPSNIDTEREKFAWSRGVMSNWIRPVRIPEKGIQRSGGPDHIHLENEYYFTIKVVVEGISLRKRGDGGWIYANCPSRIRDMIFKVMNE